jgi:benzodiazapine receptor
VNIFKVNGIFDLKKLFLCIFISEGVGFLSAALSMGTISAKYVQLVQPSFAPPGWVFGPVWSLLYFLMAIACYRVWIAGTTEVPVSKSLFYYHLQLFFNFLWTIIFFRFQLRGWAFADIIILLLLIIITTIYFMKQDKIAGYLMLPYIIWVSFASVLNFTIWQLNL